MEHDAHTRSLVSELTHELRDALSPLAPTLDLARLRGFDSEAVRLLAEKVERGLRHTRAILDAYSVAEQCAGEALRLALHPVPLADILQAARAELPQFERERCTFVSEGQQALVRADAERSAEMLRVVLQRLASSPPADSGIEVTLVADREIYVRTQSDAPGILRDGWLMRGARRLMALQGGALEVLRDGETQVELVMRFSAESAAAETAPSIAPEPAGDASSREDARVTSGANRILIVDDSADVRRTYGEALRAHGYQVFEAADAEQALSALKHDAPELALIDIHLSGTSGYRLAQAMRGRASSLCLVMLSGTTVDAHSRRLAREAGFNHCLDKMAGPGALRELIAAALAPGVSHGGTRTAPAD
jgi:CheY-like chemotaxis protein